MVTQTPTFRQSEYDVLIFGLYTQFFIFVRYLDSKEYAERFKKYEADYTCRLMAKYFSKKTLYGGKQ